MELSLERLKQLHEAARYAKTHGNGQVSLPADELLAVLPAEPVDVTPKAAEPSIAQNEAQRDLEPGVESHAAEVAEAIHELTGANTEVVGGVPVVDVPAVDAPVAAEPVPSEAPAIEPAPATDAV